MARQVSTDPDEIAGKKDSFVEYLARGQIDPNTGRRVSYERFAREIRVCRGTLYNWREEDGFWDRVWAMRGKVLGRYVPKALIALAKRAEKDRGDLELLLEITGLKDRTKRIDGTLTTTGTTTLEHKIPEEALRILEELGDLAGRDSQRGEVGETTEAADTGGG